MHEFVCCVDTNPDPSSLTLWDPGLWAPMCATGSVDERGAACVLVDPHGFGVHTASRRLLAGPCSRGTPGKEAPCEQAGDAPWPWQG